MKSIGMLSILLTSFQLLVISCGGPATIIPTINVTFADQYNPPHTVSGTAFTTRTTMSLGTLSNEGVEIRTHSRDVLTSYKGKCLICHGKGTPNQFPIPLTWDGKAFRSTIHTGVYAINAGSNADHTGRTSEGCTKDNCHS